MIIGFWFLVPEKKKEIHKKTRINPYQKVVHNNSNNNNKVEL